MIEKIFGVAVTLVIFGLIYSSFYVGRLMQMKDKDAAEFIVSNKKISKNVQTKIFVMIGLFFLIFAIINFIF